MELLLPVLIVVMVVMLIMQTLKQRKTVRQVQDLQSGLQPGDTVMTTAGLHGTVAATGESTIELEIAPGVVTTWDRRVVREKLSGEGVADAGAAPAAESIPESIEDQSAPNASTGSTPESTGFTPEPGEQSRPQSAPEDPTLGTGGAGSAGGAGETRPEGTDPR